MDPPKEEHSSKNQPVDGPQVDAFVDAAPAPDTPPAVVVAAAEAPAPTPPTPQSPPQIEPAQIERVAAARDIQPETPVQAEPTPPVEATTTKPKPKATDTLRKIVNKLKKARKADKAAPSAPVPEGETNAATPDLTVVEPVEPEVFTVERLREIHAEMKLLWDTTNERALLQNDIVELGTESPVVIKRAFCLGLELGEVRPTAGGDGDVQPSPAETYPGFVQLCAFLDAVEVLKAEVCHCDIECYVQDPVFTPQHKTFLRGMGINVLECPEAEQLIQNSGECFFYAPRLPSPVIFEALVKAKPAVYMGNTLDPFWEHGQKVLGFRTGYRKKEIRGFERTQRSVARVYVQRLMPNYEGVLGNTMYWKKRVVENRPNTATVTE